MSDEQWESIDLTPTQVVIEQPVAQRPMWYEDDAGYLPFAQTRFYEAVEN